MLQAADASDTAKDKNQLKLNARSRVESSSSSGRYHAITKPVEWDIRKTAVVVCDMWDLHHCLNATRRGAEMAPRMNRVLKVARDRGATIIHAPSSCMAAYKNHPARQRAMSVPRSENLPKDIAKWCYQIPSEEKGKYPIDQSDGGEDDDLAEHAAWAKKLSGMGRNPRAPWKSQTDLLDIHNRDYISDNGEEIWSIMEQKGIENVVLVGVHTNMCVLGRPFGLRQMAKNGKNVVLMRDMTDTMYNPKRAPFVSHFSGTDLIVKHIEKFVCSTITSDQLLGDKAFRFKNDRRPRLVIVMAEREYQTDRTLPKFAVEQLGKHFSIDFVFASDKNRNDLPGLVEALRDADVLFVSVRRRVLPKSQMNAIRRFIGSGKPIIGIRTANHAFSLRGKQPAKGYFAWEKFDRDVIGGNYTGHHGSGPKVKISATAAAKDHAILAGVDLDRLAGNGSLYKVSPVAKSASTILTGSVPDKPTEPIAWINKRAAGRGAFYTSLGHPDDFNQPAFNRFLRNAVYWMADVNIADSVPPGF